MVSRGIVYTRNWTFQQTFINYSGQCKLSMFSKESLIV